MGIVSMLTRQLAAGAGYKMMVLFFFLKHMLDLKHSSWLVHARPSSSSKEQHLTSFQNTLLSVRVKWTQAAIRRVDLIVIGQQPRLLFLPVTDTELHSEDIWCQCERGVTILDLRACGPSPFSPFVSREK